MLLAAKQDTMHNITVGARTKRIPPLPLFHHLTVCAKKKTTVVSPTSCGAYCCCFQCHRRLLLCFRAVHCFAAVLRGGVPFCRRCDRLCTLPIDRQTDRCREVAARAQRNSLGCLPLDPSTPRPPNRACVRTCVRASIIGKTHEHLGARRSTVEWPAARVDQAGPPLTLSLFLSRYFICCAWYVLLSCKSRPAPLSCCLYVLPLPFSCELCSSFVKVISLRRACSPGVQETCFSASSTRPAAPWVSACSTTVTFSART